MFASIKPRFYAAALLVAPRFCNPGSGGSRPSGGSIVVFSYTLLGFRKLLPPGRDLGDNEPGGLLDGFYSL